MLLARITMLTAALAIGSATDYAKWCSRCHGESGDGRGPAAAALAFNGRPPRDFTSGLFRFKSTPPGSPPSDADLARTIGGGLPGTSMPYFKDLLGADEIRALAARVRCFAGLPEATAGIDLGEEIPDSEDARNRGAELYRDLGCASCHGADGRGKALDAPSLQNADGSTANPTDLTRPWRFRGGSTVRDVALRLATGLDGTPMPSYLEAASTDDLQRVAHYVRSLAVATSLRDVVIADAKKPFEASSAERGAYVAKSGTCFLCHVQMNVDGSYAEKSFGAGGMKVEIRYVGTMYSRNLTPDRETGLGDWTGADFREVFRSGRSKNGRALNPLDMPWTVLAGLADADVDSLFAYLRTLPAVRNAVPSPQAPSLYDGLVAKSVALVRGDHRRAYFGFHPENFGTAAGAAADATNPKDALWLALGCGLLVVIVCRRGSGLRRVLAVLVLVAIPLLYVWPPVTLLPAPMLLAKPPFDRLAGLVGLPPIRPAPVPLASGDADLDLVAERGRYVATIGTCSLCHTGGPSWMRLRAPFPDLGGGMKVNWRVFGTTYSRNLTPDKETGLGNWIASTTCLSVQLPRPVS